MEDRVISRWVYKDAEGGIETGEEYAPAWPRSRTVAFGSGLATGALLLALSIWGGSLPGAVAGGAVQAVRAIQAGGGGGSPTPIATLTPCDYADSAAFWNSGDVLEFGNGASNDRNSVETPTNDATAYYGCNKAFRHLWTVNTSEAYSGYNWHFNPSGAISTTLREVWLVAWFDIPDSTRTKYGKWGNLHYHNTGKLRLGPGQGGEYTGDPNATSTSHIGFYGYWYAVNNAIGNRPASNQYEERGESPPKGWGLENGTNGHDNTDVPNLRTTFYGQGWKPYCIHHRIPSSWPGAPLVDFWFDDTQLIYEDTVQSNQGADYIEGWAPIENTNIWTANPTTEAVVRAGGTVWTGRVDVYDERPDAYCGP